MSHTNTVGLKTPMNYSEQTNIRGILSIFFANLVFMRRTFIFCIILCIPTALFAPTYYTITGNIVVLSKKIQQGHVSPSGSRYIPVSLSDMETENNILRSVPLLKETVTQLFDEGALYLEKGLLDKLIRTPLQTHIISPLRTWITGIEHDPRAGAIDTLTLMILDSLEIITIPGSNIIAINFESDNPKMAQAFVDRLMHNYINKRNKLILNEAPEEFFLQMKNIYQDRLKELEQKKVALFNQHGVSNPTQELSLTLENINRESSDLQQLKEQQLEADAWNSYLEEHLAQLKKSSLTNISFPFTASAGNNVKISINDESELRQQIQKIADLQSEYALAQSAYRKDSPKVTKPLNHLKQEKKRLITLVENRLLERKAAQGVLAKIIQTKTSHIKKYRDRSQILKAVAALEAEIVTELRAVNDAYFRYSQQYEEKRSTRIADIEELSNVRILAKTPIPIEPSSPKKPLLLIFALLTSGFITLSLGFIKKLYNHRFYYPEQSMEKLNLPVIATFDDASDVRHSHQPQHVYGA